MELRSARGHKDGSMFACFMSENIDGNSGIPGNRDAAGAVRCQIEAIVSRNELARQRRPPSVYEATL